jgi:ubiquinone/menaquinone biosynthesis C-methylase UbiE
MSKKRDTYIWGAGLYGQRVVIQYYKDPSINIVGFIDSNKALWNTQKLGFTIYSPKEILQKQNIQILIAVVNKEAIKEISEICKNANVENIILPSSNMMHCKEIDERIEIAGKRILEIGCGNGDLLKYIAMNNNPEYIIGIDMSLSEWWGVGESSGVNWEVRDGNAEELSFADESFDAVISYATFEHIYDVEKSLREIKRVLKPSGKFFTNFSPIWTSVIGHHFIARGEKTWNKKHLELIPPWGHLYMNEYQMLEYLKNLIERDLLDNIIQFIYHSNIINRRSRKYLMNTIMNCGMIIKEYREKSAFNRFTMFEENDKSELTNCILEKIIAAGYDIMDLGVIGITVCLEKYPTI